LKDPNQTEIQLINELAELRKRIAELKILEDERKQTEEALRKSEERYRTLFEESRDAIYTTTQEGEILDANQSMIDLFGYTKEEMIGFTAGKAYVHSEDRLKFQQMIEREGFVKDHEIKLRKKDGTEMECLLTSIVRRNADGDAVGYQGIIRDITERKQAQEKLHAILDRYRSYIEVTGQLGWITNANGEVVEDISSWRKFTGQSEDEVKGWGWSKAIHSDDLERTIQVWTRAIATKSIYEVEHRVRRYDGVYQYFLARGVPVFKEDGNIREWVGTCIDITERKQKEEEREKLIHELQDALSNIKMLRGLLPICSHCKKIRDDKGYWNQIESYIRDHSDAEFSHGICPQCMKKLYPDFDDLAK